MQLMPLRYPGTCVDCGDAIAAKATAWYDPSTKRVTCTTCRPTASPMSLDLGAPDPRS